METKEDVRVHLPEEPNCVRLPEVNKFIHGTDYGTLTTRFLEENNVPPVSGGVTEIPDDDPYAPYTVYLTFENSDKELYNATYSSKKLSKICFYLALRDKARAIFSERPRISFPIDNEIYVTYKVTDGSNEYSPVLLLYKQDIDYKNNEIDKLQAENRVLHNLLKAAEHDVEDIKANAKRLERCNFLKNLIDLDRPLFSAISEALRAGKEDTMWDEFLDHGFADSMRLKGGEHILINAISSYRFGIDAWGSFCKFRFDRLANLMKQMTITSIKCNDGKSIVQWIEENMIRDNMYECRVAWLELRDHAVRCGFN